MSSDKIALFHLHPRGILFDLNRKYHDKIKFEQSHFSLEVFLNQCRWKCMPISLFFGQVMVLLMWFKNNGNKRTWTFEREEYYVLVPFRLNYWTWRTWNEIVDQNTKESKENMTAKNKCRSDTSSDEEDNSKKYF